MNKEKKWYQKNNFLTRPQKSKDTIFLIMDAEQFKAIEKLAGER